MDEKEMLWEILGTCQRTRVSCEKAREKIKSKDYDILIKSDEFELNMSDLLSQDEHNAIAEIIDSLILGEINRNKVQEFKAWEKLKKE